MDHALAPAGAEMIASMGFDYIGIDCQHGLIAYEDMRDILLVVNGLPVSPIVRVPSNDDWWIGKALDAGAEGIIVPLVNSAADAERAARACRFPPDGVRSYGLARGQLPLGRTPQEVNSNVLCIPMIETRQGLDAADPICADAKRRSGQGFRMVTVCADASLLGVGSATELGAARG